MTRTRLIIGADGAQMEEVLTDDQVAQLRPPRIGIAVDKETIEANGVDYLTLSLQLQDGAERAIQATATLRIILPDHTWQEFTTNANGYCELIVDAVWPKQYKIQVIDPEASYSGATISITAIGNYPDAAGNVHFTLGEVWRKAAQDQALETAEVASLEDAIADAGDLADVQAILERMARQMRLVKQYGRMLWHANTDDIMPYLEQ